MMTDERNKRLLMEGMSKGSKLLIVKNTSQKKVDKAGSPIFCHGRSHSKVFEGRSTFQHLSHVKHGSHTSERGLSIGSSPPDLSGQKSCLFCQLCQGQLTVVAASQAPFPVFRLHLGEHLLMGVFFSTPSFTELSPGCPNVFDKFAVLLAWSADDVRDLVALTTKKLSVQAHIWAIDSFLGSGRT